MLEPLESLLGRWTGRANWPATRATLEERVKIPQGDLTSVVPNMETADIFSWEVDGKTYVADIVEIAGEKNLMGPVGHKIALQYNPRRPSQFYYPPACQLSRRAIVVVCLSIVAIAIILAIALHR